jgi:L-asparaginase
MNHPPSILIIYTGGTIGMVNDPETGALYPLDFKQVSNYVPELKRFGYQLSALSFDPPIDSSNVEPGTWIRLAEVIEQNYEDFDGFVILHGTDTMAYSASALSFLLENLGKPVIFTGSQLPIGIIRTDGKENLISAIEIAADKKQGKPIVPEVCIFFQNKLFRGNRTIKYNAEYFNAFRSDNYPVLAETGIKISYHHSGILKPRSRAQLIVHKTLDTNVAIVKVFPGISENVLASVFNTPGLRGVILETYGSGNAPTSPWFLRMIQRASDKGIIILNVTQCSAGKVDMSLYETGKKLLGSGVISGKDITTESALTKLMFLLGNKPYNDSELRKLLNKSLRGEINE